MKLQTLLKGQKPIGIYYASWSDPWASSSSSSGLLQISSPTNIVYMSFATPSCTYVSGSNTLTGTGLDFSSDFSVIKGAIALLKAKGIICMLSVGGATYAYTTFNPTNIAALVNDLGCAGVDIDWEPSNGTQAASQLGPIIQQFRSALPNGCISLAGFSVGAYGQGEFTNAVPTSGNTGMCIQGLQSNGTMLDWINIMSYDAGIQPAGYDPTIAFKSYRSYFSGPLMIGVEVPPEAWGGNVITLSQVQSYAQYIIKQNTSTVINGMFVWSYQKSGSPSCSDIISTTNSVFANVPTPPTPIQPTPIQPTPIQPTPTPPSVSKWSTGVNYKVGQNVIYNEISYICNKENLASSLCAPGFNPWTITSIPIPSPTPGTTSWATGVSYSPGQIVSYQGHTYKCLQSNTSQTSWEPTNVPALWSLMS